MARMHSRKKGKSGRKRPKSKTLPEWVKADRAEIEEVILKMAREGVPPSRIGLVLRDRYAVPEVKLLLDMPLVAFLRKNKVAGEYPEDILELIKRAVRMRRHLKKSKADLHNSTKYNHVVSKILRLAKYYERNGVIPKGWKYDPEQAELLVK
ncbi:30S ribosomal protein S15 [Candidatus Micrarchaeota archaeon]|nr:30S ribosomal protein S15 [Candidatus Micrarchaeota archaeon]